MEFAYYDGFLVLENWQLPGYFKMGNTDKSPYQSGTIFLKSIRYHSVPK